MYKQAVLYVQAGCTICTSRLYYMYKQAVLYVQVGCTICTSRLYYMYKQVVLYVQVGSVATCLVSTFKGTLNLYFLSELLAISTG